MDFADFTYLGHDFTLFYDGGRASGVVSREGANIDAPDYFEALRVAHLAYRYFIISIFIKHHLGYRTEQFSKQECEHLLAKLAEFFNQSLLPIPGNYFTFYDAVKLRLSKIQEKERKQAKQSSSKTTNGFVYLIQSPTGYYKIGRTKDPNDRIATFSVKLPFEVEYVCVIQTSDMYSLETILHNRYAKQRVNGEWFQLTPEDVEYIKGLAS